MSIDWNFYKIECPYCEAEVDEEYDIRLSDIDGDCWKLNCPYCKKDFLCEYELFVDVEVEFNTSKFE